MIGVRMQPLLAAVDGTSPGSAREPGTSGHGITITGADGWYYNYFHVNNDTPGTDDGPPDPNGRWLRNSRSEAGSAPVRSSRTWATAGTPKARSSPALRRSAVRTGADQPLPEPHRRPATPDMRSRRRPAWCYPVDPAPLSSGCRGDHPPRGGGRWLIDSDGRIVAEQPPHRADCRHHLCDDTRGQHDGTRRRGGTAPRRERCTPPPRRGNHSTSRRSQSMAAWREHHRRRSATSRRAGEASR